MRIVIRKPTSVEQQLLDQLGVAIANKQVVRFTYTNLLRTVDPELGKALHWRLFQLAKIHDMTVLAECFVPRAGYQGADEDMSKIIHQV